MFHLYNKYWKYYAAEAILAPIFKILEAIFALLVPFVVKNIIDQGIVANQGQQYIINQGLILLGLAVVGFMTTMVCQILTVKVSSTFAYHLHDDLYRHINTFSLKEDSQYTSSSLETRLSSDVTISQKGLSLLLRLAIRAPFLVIGSIIMAFIVSPKSGWVFILVGVLLGLVIYLISYLSVPYNRKIQKQLEGVTSIAEDNLTGTRVVRAFNKEDYERKRFFSSVDFLQLTSKRLAVVSSFLNPLNSSIVNLGIILILYFGKLNIANNTMSSGDVIALVNYMSQISAAVVVVANLVVVFSKATASSKRLSEILEKDTDLVSGTAKTPFNSPDIVEFQNVTFSYNKDSEPAIKDLSFKVKKGQTVGIIGGTGSGKTTLADLLDRFFDPDQGKILINGTKLKDYDLSYLRSHIGYVSQKSVLFSGTIESNLLMGNPKATKDDMEEALKVSQSTDIVLSRPEGVKAEVVQGGKNFSGGQKQRLSIARALIKKPDILILDDSSSALDFKTDYQLRKAIKESEKDATVFIVSQRISSLNDADLILVLDQGKLVGQGTKDELLTNCPVFIQIAQSQAKTKGVD
jgi:ATP-binding cassette subfamily B multidrug efflux pump